MTIGITPKSGDILWIYVIYRRHHCAHVGLVGGQKRFYGADALCGGEIEGGVVAILLICFDPPSSNQ